MMQHNNVFKDSKGDCLQVLRENQIIHEMYKLHNDFLGGLNEHGLSQEPQEGLQFLFVIS